MFINCQDLKNALLTAAKLTEAYKELNIHMNVFNELQAARDLLVAYIMLSQDFVPTNLTDMKYLWDVWYSSQWNEATRARFVIDVKKLSKGQWVTCPIAVPHQENANKLKEIFQMWLKNAFNISARLVMILKEGR